MNVKLQRVLERPIKTILDVRLCFDYCATTDDIIRVIKKIPPKFGEFEIMMVSEDQSYFMIQNFFEKNGETKSQIVTYDFYKTREDLYYDYR
jgi:hypothetical protein